MVSLIYGYDVKSYDDDLLVVLRKITELGGTVLPGTVLVNEIPLCKTFFFLPPNWIRRRGANNNTDDYFFFFSETYSCVDPVAEL